MPLLTTARLHEFVGMVNENAGDHLAQLVRDAYYPVYLEYNTHVDEKLDPFSLEYYEQQVALYKEISGRDLDQATGELHDQDMMPLVNTSNPTGIIDVNTVSETIRALATMLSLAELGTSARVIDLGAGHGLSSEVFAFAGCIVDAVDIDENLNALAQMRASRLGLAINRSYGNFDDISNIDRSDYDAALFFQSFHHCLKPWELIAQLKAKIKSHGVIAFSGEPIQSTWWKHWGIRLDAESLYVARQRGWFESGWSHTFLRECFSRSGMALTFFSGGLLGGEIGVATIETTRRDALLLRARAMGLIETNAVEDLGFTDNSYRSESGRPAMLAGRPAFVHDGARGGMLIYGPYTALDPGPYELSLLIRRETAPVVSLGQNLVIEVTSDSGETKLMNWRVGGFVRRRLKLIRYRFEIEEPASSVEFRVRVLRGGWTVSIPALSRAPT